MDPIDRDLMIRTMIGEAANEPPEGQAGVGHVILNRMKSGDWGNNVRGVVLAPGQFEPWATRRRELMSISPRSKSYQNMGKVADAVIAGKIPDPTGGADHFLNPDIVQARYGRQPDWARGRPSAVIGGHTFFGPQKDLLGAWGTGAPLAPAETVPEVATSPDLLGGWKAPEEENKAVAEAKIEPPANESARELINRKLSENQGTGFVSGAARLGLGALRGVADVADTLGTAAAETVRYGANTRLGGLISPETASVVGNWADTIEGRAAAGREGFDKAAGDSTLATVGRIGGQLAGSAPFLGAAGAALGPAVSGLPTVARLAATGAGAGAGTAALTSSANEGSVPEQIATGAALGGALGPAGYGLSAGFAGARNAVLGKIDKTTALLADAARRYGIDITPGQLSNNTMTRFADSVLQRLPFSGYASRTEGQTSAFNRAISNAFGEDTDKITTQTIRDAKDRIGKTFEDVATRTGTIRADAPFYQKMSDILTDARSVLPDAEVSPIESQMRNIISKVDPGAHTLDAESYQALTRKNAPLSRAQQSSNPNIRHYANQVRDALDDVMERSAPADVVEDLRGARSQWKALKTVEPLAKKATTGNISPQALLAKVNASYAGSGGDLGELGRIGQRFLTEPQSSGTAERLLAMKGLGALGGALGLGGAYAFDPENFQRDAALLLGGVAGGRGVSALLRNRALSQSMINSALGRSGGAQPVANFLSRTAPLQVLVYPNARRLSNAPPGE